MTRQPAITVRPILPSDRDGWGRMRSALWADQTGDDMRCWLEREDAVTLLAHGPDGGLVGFAEAGERAWAEGAARGPVAYLEGWYVEPEWRGQGVGGALIRAVEAWARDRGYRDLCSDASPDNPVSLQAHGRLGFVEVERAVLFHKAL